MIQKQTSPFFSSILFHFQNNWKPGLTVGLITLPLAISLAVACGATPAMGIVTAFWGCLIASIFGSSNYNIIGPAGALAGILHLQAELHGISCLPMLALGAGVFILIGQMLKVEKYLTFVPGSALHGFILAVAASIIANQIPTALGIPAPSKSLPLFSKLSFLIDNLHAISLITVCFFILSLISLIGFARYVPKIPGTMIIAPIGILFGYLSSIKLLPWHIQTLADKFQTTQPTVSLAFDPHFKIAYLFPSFIIAIIASIETLISARIADGMTKTKHCKRKELIGLGLANICCGIAGGIPVTAVLARTMVNIRSGSKHRISATIASFCVLLIIVTCLQLFYYIPMALIAALLVFVAGRLLQAEHFVYMFKTDKKNFLIAIVVAFITVYENPIMGLLMGSIIAMLLFMETLSSGYHEIRYNSPIINTNNNAVLTHPNHSLVYAIKGPLVYINAQAHIARIEGLKETCHQVVIDLKEMFFIDLDGANALSIMIQTLEDAHVIVTITNISPLAIHILVSNAFLKKKLRDN